MVLPGRQFEDDIRAHMTFDCDIPESLSGFATRPRQEKNEPICGSPTHDVTHPREKPESVMTNVIHDG